MSTPSFTTLRLSRQGPVALCTFARPEARNALSEQMVDELHTLLDHLSGDADIACLVFSGGPGLFVSGADIAELRARTSADALRRINTGICRHIDQFPWPTLAAIEGYALGGGLELALACDLRVCARDAKLGQPEVSLGIIPGAGATYRLTRLVGPGVARDLVLTGRRLDAEEAMRLGLVNRLVDKGDAEKVALELAQEITANGRLALRYAKQMLGVVHELSTDAAMALEATSQAVLFDDADKNARMDAFLAKRKRDK